MVDPIKINEYSQNLTDHSTNSIVLAPHVASNITSAAMPETLAHLFWPGHGMALRPRDPHGQEPLLVVLDDVSVLCMDLADGTDLLARLEALQHLVVSQHEDVLQRKYQTMLTWMVLNCF